MKNLYLLLAFVLIPIFSFAELQIKIGNDTTFCGFNRNDAPKLGTNLKITGGVPPYKYAWSAEIPGWQQSYYASRFLNDTTVSAPTFKDFFYDHWTPFTLTVTDAENNTATDIINVRFSMFLYLTLPVLEFHYNIGDEITLANYIITNGIEPYRSYAWSPTDDLLTPNEKTTLCKVTQAADYYLTIEDAAGCKTTTLMARVRLLSTGIIETESVDNDIPVVKDGILFWENAEKLPVKINLYSLTGAKIQEIYPVANEYSLKTNVSIPVLYEIIIGNKQYIGKYIFNQ